MLVPATLPQLLVGARIGLTQAWLFLVAAELLAATNGLGFLLTDGQQTSRTDEILVAILLFARVRQALGDGDARAREAAGRLDGHGAGMTGSARIRGLRKAFGAHVVLDGIDVDVANGERVAILGASGCGKSTLLRCIAGLERPDTGTIATSGEIGVVFQEPRLFPWLDVRRNVAFPARSDAERSRVDNVLALVGLAHAASRLPKQLSGGMAQRAALARALVRDPALLLLDEPFAALDALRRIELRAAVREILEFTRASAILVTHDVDDALALADRVLVLAGSPAEIAFEGIVGEDATRGTILDALGVPEVRRSLPAPRSVRHGASHTCAGPGA